MAHSAKHARNTSADPCSSYSTELRTSLAETPMCRHSSPLPAQDRYCGCQGGWGAILAALEQQNALLTELLGAITGLTAACLCQGKEHC